jgi:hypothetical protein
MTSAEKETEVRELRTKIDALRQLSAKAGINVDGLLCGAEAAAEKASCVNGRRHTHEHQAEGSLNRQPSMESVVSSVSHKSTDSKASRFERGSVRSAGAASAAKKGWVSALDDTFDHTLHSCRHLMWTQSRYAHNSVLFVL